MSRSTPQINSNQPLGGRYKVINQLGVGGFGRTFLAEDLHLPGHPRCVVKQLKPQFRSDDTLQMARRCFNTEAEVLYQLGNHEQIPRLLAHFEDQQDFYLAQEFIEGVPLTKELKEGRPWSEARVVALLQDILQVLTFVHQQNVIHRDLKPSNLIRRSTDGKIVLIDFGAVKQVSTAVYEPDTGETNLTISIGTQGYMPNEQLAGKPRFSSDIYAVGVLGIQALTGIHPKHLIEDEKGELAWRHRAGHAHPELMDILERMVRYDFRDRFPTAVEALVAMEQLPPAFNTVPPAFHAPHSEDSLETDLTYQSHHHSLPRTEASSSDLTVTGEDGASTAIWVQSSSEQAVPSTNRTGNFGRTDGAELNLEFSETSLTQAIDRPRRDPNIMIEVPTKLQKPAHSVLWIGLAAAVAAITTSVLVIALLPRMGPWMQNAGGRSPIPSPSESPAPPDLSSTNATEVYDYANQLMEQQQYETALSFYDRAIELSPDDAAAYAGRCEALNQLNSPESAIVACNDALAYEPDSVQALWSKGNALLLQNRTYEALSLYETVTEKDAKFEPGWVKRGVALQRLGRSSEALDALDQAIALERNSAEAWSTKGEALVNLQRYDEASIALDKALQLQDPNDPKTMELRQQVRAILNR
ncbi:protein kinase domain-containing protein [Thermocoleostomius sinensis]|uniref:non-specific serine/threonine protein kinase n=1 Tax=Thermocoleostomius sinensis A174 TaxID=2016057 RepID=A0A9E9C756_9CYAN|nr:serine/threonine-protein kinase [Thermocoleostomius sinensis]WAL58908.1 serine/threonine-protein kinase [Thermocoleostomius sinensis A174]